MVLQILQGSVIGTLGNNKYFDEHGAINASPVPRDRQEGGLISEQNQRKRRFRIFYFYVG
ncbi:hypothetical protein DSCO28_16360 [Desulfosarcina ovata subsp. sediminis]|uniref:Uncharacterized protein n=1 Tax=Desulfosarcina ovata subsp. sediminis TaxID=885957 RepID=A0A5K7ZPS0_9BACT|nr:hypothetical protein DSCO28_16360 [Desulfosarcina ovata subsp. sediminis]